jgi:hypothetical protein
VSFKPSSPLKKKSRGGRRGVVPTPLLALNRRGGGNREPAQ